jgi:XTP/dITP diphosphohydrolase
MHKLLIGTNNPDKLAELREIFADIPVHLTSPHEEGLTLDPEETGATFAENAILKARIFAQATGLPALADDSGLEVDAMGGEPGIYSARYGDTAKNDHVGRYRIVLDRLRETPWAERTARFRCVLAVVTPEAVLGVVDGAVEGFIAYEPKGHNGFGYDPIFFVPELNLNLAEISAAEKHAISHRGRAARAAIPLIRQLFQPE